MLLQHGWVKGHPGERRSPGRRNSAHPEKRTRRERETIFVTYLPKRWVQTNKMERVNVILRNEWISPDIYHGVPYIYCSSHIILRYVKFADVVIHTYEPQICCKFCALDFRYLVGFAFIMSVRSMKCHCLKLCVRCNPRSPEDVLLLESGVFHPSTSWSN